MKLISCPLVASAACLAAALLPGTAAADAAAAAAPAAQERAPQAAPSGGGRALDDVGQLREITIQGPRAAELAVDNAPVADRAPPALAAVSSDPHPANDSDVTAELAARQMRRYRPRLDACVAAAVRRSDKSAGTVMLAFEIANRRVTHVTVSDDGVHDALLSRCLVDAGGRLSFSLAAARFSWPVTIPLHAAPLTVAR
jgi:hypothetical protein